MISSIVRRSTGAALDLVFPSVFAGCEALGAFLCERCWDLVEGGVSLCQVCRGPRPAFEALRGPYAFQGVAREAVHRLKYGGLSAAAPALAERIAIAWPHWALDADIVVPTPLHPRRLRSRGYHQAAQLAKPLVQMLDLPYVDGATRRTSATRAPAAGRGRAPRRQELAGTFAPGPSQQAAVVRRRRVLLVDEVESGAASVVAVVFARDGSPLTKPGPR